MNDESPEKYRQWVTHNLKSDIPEQLFDIYKESMYENQNDAGRISKTIAKASTLMARLSADQAVAAKRLERFTVWLISLTVVLIGVAVIQIVKC
jgi:hypothetical protein